MTYIALIIAIIIAGVLIKNVMSCAFRFLCVLLLIGILAYVYFSHLA